MRSTLSLVKNSVSKAALFCKILEILKIRKNYLTGTVCVSTIVVCSYFFWALGAQQHSLFLILFFLILFS